MSRSSLVKTFPSTGGMYSCGAVEEEAVEQTRQMLLKEPKDEENAIESGPLCEANVPD